MCLTINTAPGQRTTTIVFGLAAATWLTSASWAVPSERLNRSKPSVEVTATLTMTVSTVFATATEAAIWAGLTLVVQPSWSHCEAPGGTLKADSTAASEGSGGILKADSTAVLEGSGFGVARGLRARSHVASFTWPMPQDLYVTVWLHTTMPEAPSGAEQAGGGGGGGGAGGSGDGLVPHT